MINPECPGYPEKIMCKQSYLRRRQTTEKVSGL